MCIGQPRFNHCGINQAMWWGRLKRGLVQAVRTDQIYGRLDEGHTQAGVHAAQEVLGCGQSVAGPRLLPQHTAHLTHTWTQGVTRLYTAGPGLCSLLALSHGTLNTRDNLANTLRALTKISAGKWARTSFGSFGSELKSISDRSSVKEEETNPHRHNQWRTN